MKKLNEIYQNYSMNDCGGDKGTMHSYIESYDKIFESRPKEQISLLEIGVYEGHSLMMWSDYFINSKIIGVDIDIKRSKFNDPNRFELIEADATQEDLLNNPSIKNTKFDYIIDDGSHRIEDQIKSYKILSNHLKDDGIYIIEDIADIDTYRLMFLSLSPNVEIIDLRRNKNRYDDILVVVRK